MATSVTTTGITFPDATTQTTAATGVSTTYNALGTYCAAYLNETTSVSGGSTRASTSLKYNSSGGGAGASLGGTSYLQNGNLSGTWRLMTIQIKGYNDGEGGLSYPAAVWVRIS